MNIRAIRYMLSLRFAMYRFWLVCVLLGLSTNSTFSQTPSSLGENNGILLHKVFDGMSPPISIGYTPDELLIVFKSWPSWSVKFFDKSGKELGLFEQNSQKTISKQPIGNLFPLNLVYGKNPAHVWLPHDLGIGQSKNLAERCTNASNQLEGRLYQIDLENYSLIGAVKVGNLPVGIDQLPASNLLLSANYCSKDISIVDTRTRKELKRILLGSNPVGLKVNTKDRKAYALMADASRIATIDLDRLELEGFMDTGQKLIQFQIGPLTNNIYACSAGKGKLVKIDSQKESVISLSRRSDGITRLVISPDEKYIYAISRHNAKLIKLATTNFKPLAITQLPHKPKEILLDKSGSNIWISTTNGKVIHLIDKKAWQAKRATLKGPNPPNWQESLDNLKDPWFDLNFVSKEELYSHLKITTSPFTLQRNENVSSLRESNNYKVLDKQTSIEYNRRPQNQQVFPTCKPYDLGLTTSELTVLPKQAFHLVVGTYRKKNRALSVADTWKYEGFDPLIIPIKADAWRVSLLGCESKENAERLKRSLDAKGIANWIWTR